ncbi:hypothetical protein A2U01_0116820, partial [Trifolium medium]|nr:hypothetical protein [Trifolium medium]
MAEPVSCSAMSAKSCFTTLNSICISSSGTTRVICVV